MLHWGGRVPLEFIKKIGQALTDVINTGNETYVYINVIIFYATEY